MSEAPTIQPLNPWKSLWLKPRQTIRQIVSTNPTLHVIPIVLVYGGLQTLDNGAERNLGDRFAGLDGVLSVNAYLLLVVGLFVVGALLALVMWLYLTAWLLEWTGGWLNGKASLEELRAAMAWSVIPILIALILGIPSYIYLGPEAFTSYTPKLDNSEIIGLIYYIPLLVIAIGLFIWSIFTSCHMIGEVQGFSAWTAAWNYILVCLVCAIPVLLIAFLFGFLFAGFQ